MTQSASGAVVKHAVRREIVSNLAHVRSRAQTTGACVTRALHFACFVGRWALGVRRVRMCSDDVVLRQFEGAELDLSPTTSSARVKLPFSFPFGLHTHKDMVVQRNGFVTFGASDAPPLLTSADAASGASMRSIAAAFDVLVHNRSTGWAGTNMR